MARTGGTFADARIPGSSSINLTSHLSGFTFHVLYACRHLTEIKEERGQSKRVSHDQEQSSRGSTCAFVILCAFWPWVQMITTEDLCGFAHLDAICSFKPGITTSVRNVLFFTLPGPEVWFSKALKPEGHFPIGCAYVYIRSIRNAGAFRSVVLSAFVCNCIPCSSVFQSHVFTNYWNALWYSHRDYVK